MCVFVCVCVCVCMYKEIDWSLRIDSYDHEGGIWNL